ncbi:MAG TPA: protein-L-isoaspartate O-methyltransferase [Rudaea sp.]|nr:protein-L-isoaspartate O-methyltransferase [Rudaea sp.]
MRMNIELARHNMVEQQVRPWDVLDARVLEALSAIRREDFVPPACRNLAFADMCLPLGHGEVMMKPVVEGRILQAAAPTHSEKVLEIGTGSGFLTACLARLGGEVHSVEIHPDLADGARDRLRVSNVTNAKVEIAEAVGGFKPGRRYDVMVVTGAVNTLPQHWRDWIEPAGRIVAIIGKSPVQHAVLCVRDGDGWEQQTLFETDLPYLHNAAPVPQFVL